MVKIIYAVLLGVILAFFVGLGIEAFYPTQRYPETPAILQYDKVNTTPQTAEQIKAQENYDLTVKDWTEKNATHARNVSVIAIIGSIIFMILSLTILAKKDVFSNGFMLGSLFTLIYGIGRGFEGDDNKFRFLIVTIGLIATLTLGYFKFLKQEEK
ncbi:MAG: hypothetical protein WCO23_01655 [bacterium]